jgi:hypothetical protein
MLAPDLSARFAAATLRAVLDEVQSLAIAPHARDRIVALLDGVREHYCQAPASPPARVEAIEQNERAPGTVVQFHPKRRA